MQASCLFKYIAEINFFMKVMIACGVICSLEKMEGKQHDCTYVPNTVQREIQKEETFANFAVLWLSTKVFCAKVGGVGSFGAAKASNLRKFSLRKFTNSQKFSLSKVFHYTVCTLYSCRCRQKLHGGVFFFLQTVRSHLHL